MQDPVSASIQQHNLSAAEMARIRELASVHRLGPDTLVFAEGDDSDCLYFIESGQVSVSIQKFTLRDEIAVLGPGEYFGEMGVLNNGQRAASVTTISDSCLLSLGKSACIALLADDQLLAQKIGQILERRNTDLLRRENVESGACFSIKGDPSLRESAFERERYQSMADKVLPRLTPSLLELLLERSVCDVTIHFNSGSARSAALISGLKWRIDS
ncbi:MAG: cyclic nucleotide-binding domain-containing protein, partial [Gammaproteobacteria bacterium]|nr:cyclic nucleotide-binding domain-containing protein [Gammaproteobacteria bacterium]